VAPPPPAPTPPPVSRSPPRFTPPVPSTQPAARQERPESPPERLLANPTNPKRLAPEPQRLQELRFELAELDLLLASVARRMEQEAILHPDQGRFISADEQIRELRQDLTELDVLLGRTTGEDNPRSTDPKATPDEVDALLERLVLETRGSPDHHVGPEPGRPRSRESLVQGYRSTPASDEGA
jgi:hypothetical protein